MQTAEFSTPYGKITAQYHNRDSVTFTTGRGWDNESGEPSPLKINRLDVSLTVELIADSSIPSRPFRVGYFRRARWGSYNTADLPAGANEKVLDLVYNDLWGLAQSRPELFQAAELDDLKRQADALEQEAERLEAEAKERRTEARRLLELREATKISQALSRAP